MDSRLHNAHISANKLVCGILWGIGFLLLAYALLPGDHADGDVGRVGIALILTGNFRAVTGMLYRIRQLERDQYDLSRDSAMIRRLERNAFELGRDSAMKSRTLTSVGDSDSG